MVPEILDIFYGISGYKKSDGVSEPVSWGELAASIVANTSMTPKDINELSYPELEELMKGMESNANRQKEEMDNGPKKDAHALLDFISAHDGGL